MPSLGGCTWGPSGVPRKGHRRHSHSHQGASVSGCLGHGIHTNLPSLPPIHSQVDRLVALARMRQSGAFLSTSEGLILQLVGDAAHPQFKEVMPSRPPPPPLHLTKVLSLGSGNTSRHQQAAASRGRQVLGGEAAGHCHHHKSMKGAGRWTTRTTESDEMGEAIQRVRAQRREFVLEGLGGILEQVTLE